MTNDRFDLVIPNQEIPNNSIRFLTSGELRDLIQRDLQSLRFGKANRAKDD